MKRNKTINPVITGKPPSAMTGNHHYERNGNVLQIDKLLALKPEKTVSYMRQTYYSRGGAKFNEQYVKTLADGYMICVDVTNVRIGIVLALKADQSIWPSSRVEFNKHFKRVLKVLSR